MDEINDLPETMMCGIINHAMGIYELHVIPENHAHDASLTISILHNHIVRILRMMKVRPLTLHLQFDNSGKDNKNRFMIAYAGVSKINI